MREHLRPKTLPNRMSPWATDDEEREDRRAAVETHLAVLRTQLPDLLCRFARIPDPRRPGSVRHQITVLLVYGVLLFAFAMESRRQANRELSRPGLWAALRVAFPELDSVPHADTLARLLEKIEPGDIEAVLMARMRALLRRQKLQALLVEREYVVAVDGEKLWQRTQAFAPEAQHRGENDEARYAVYVVKAALCCPEGVTLPLAAEFCENVQVGKDGKVDEEQKQDCEYRATERLCARLKAAFPRLPILFVADGLYACVPIAEMCRRNHWDFMVVLKEGKMPALWREANALHTLDAKWNKNTLRHTWRKREQTFWWANDIEHEVWNSKGRRRFVFHVVVCEERWRERRADGTEEEKTARHAWVSGKRLDAKNVHKRCNLAARHRWDIEEEISAEKHQEHMTHAFSLTWQAIKNWYYLMLIGTLIQTLALYSVHLWRWVLERGVRGTKQFLWESYTGAWLDLGRLRRSLERPAQLRLIV